MHFLELPEDVLTIIFSFLDPKTFLSLCKSTKSLYIEYRQESGFWRNATSNTFRLPISPLLKADGARWYWLYKRLKTQTKLYAWGSGIKGNLGPGRGLPPPQFLQMRGRRPIRPPVVHQRTTASWPAETHLPEEVGTVADLQCGGWSTTILTSQGRLYTTGSIDSKDGLEVGETVSRFTQLVYLTQSTTNVKQFSAGRRHVLALTDDGDIVSWDRVNAKGLKIFPSTGRSFGGKPTRVTAGWAESSVYVPEAGIVYWEPIKNDQADEMLDGRHVQHGTIPGTAQHRDPKGNLIGVNAHIVLEGYIVWVTTDSKVLASQIHHTQPDDAEPQDPPFEVPGYSSPDDRVEDIQGSYLKFVVFTKSGRVLAGNIDYIRACSIRAREQASEQSLGSDDELSLSQLLQSRPPDIPALQKTGVIAVAFGDHHYHALHANGTATTHGVESRSCGSLGLGEVRGGGRFRGMYENHGPDSNLLPVAAIRGREIWFEPEKKDWLSWMSSMVMGGQLQYRDADGRSQPATSLFGDHEKKSMFSEWIEQEGRHWNEGPLGWGSHEARANPEETKSSPPTEQHDDVEIDPYFVISISAAGWHSGALVLVDDERAHKIRQKWVTIGDESDQQGEDVHLRRMPGHFEAPKADPEERYVWEIQGFPKVRLPNGFEMPGQGEIREWRDGMPTAQDLGF